MTIFTNNKIIQIFFNWKCWNIFDFGEEIYDETHSDSYLILGPVIFKHFPILSKTTADWAINYHMYFK